jgi:hypothetical protein
MLIHFVFFILNLMIYQSAFAAGAPCLNYETFKHPTLPVPAFNQALVNYNYAIIQAQNAVIPPLAVGAHQLGISLMRQGGPAVIPWQHVVFPVGVALNLQEASLMAFDRQTIGITVRFQQPTIIMLLSAGMPIPGAGGIAAFLGIAPVNVTAYANHALRSGGYLTPLATTLYRLRNIFPPPNFAVLIGPGAPIADCVIIHIHDPRRVSKNIKELSFNSILNPALPGILPYFSIKDMIDVQFLPPNTPHSGTIVSSDFLQVN